MWLLESLRAKRLIESRAHWTRAQLVDKVAAIVETATPLHLGLRGKYKGKRFDLVGHVQFQHLAFFCCRGVHAQ